MLGQFDLEAYNAVVRANPGEIDQCFPADAVEGRLPDELVGGTFWGNGPSMLDLNGRLVHPLDGHGYIRALRLASQGSRLQTRFVRTPAYEEERAKGRISRKGIGTMVEGGFLANLGKRNRNVANTCVLPWAGRVLALWEGGLPYALDGETLETCGVETFGGALSEGTAFLAHTRVLGGTLVGLCPAVEGMSTRYRFLEIDSSGALVSSREAVLDGLCAIHDFAVTPDWYVVIEAAISVDVVQFLKERLGFAPIINALKQRKGSGRALLVPRRGGAPRIVDFGFPSFSVHYANAWEEDGRVIVVASAFERYSFGREFGYRGPFAKLDPGIPAEGEYACLVRLEMDPVAGTVVRQVASPYAVDFPRVRPDFNGVRTRHVYGVVLMRPGSPDVFDALAHVDLEHRTTVQWTPGPGRFVGEPLVVPRRDGADERDAWILAMVYDGRALRSSLCILDAARVDAGPIATVRLPVLLPYGFHGEFQPGDGRRGAG